MSEITSEELPVMKSVKRLIDEFHGNKTGPNIIFFAGIHGNEPAGILALQNVIQKLKELNPPFKGNIFAVAGNIRAIESGKRFIKKDLNRIWFPNSLIPAEERDRVPEYKEKIEILSLLIKILENGRPTVIFDLHTTSSYSLPFISVSDTLKNRKIIRNIPTHLILGLEELLDGPMFSFFSELGLPAILFEAGQHNSLSSIENHTAFIWMMLNELKCITKRSIPEYRTFGEILRKNSPRGGKTYEIKYRYLIQPDEKFKMKEGFVNFQQVKKGEVLAHNENGKIHAKQNGVVFMPLYQNQGCDGFFIISQITSFWFKMSAGTRRWKLDKTLPLLPGIKKVRKEDAYLIDENTAGNKLISLLHLLGYRKVASVDTYLKMSRRPYDNRSPNIAVVRENFQKYLRLLTD